MPIMFFVVGVVVAFLFRPTYYKLYYVPTVSIVCRVACTRAFNVILLSKKSYAVVGIMIISLRV